MTLGYKGLHGVTRGYTGYRKLQGVSRAYGGFQEVTGDNKGVKRVTVG